MSKKFLMVLVIFLIGISYTCPNVDAQSTMTEKQYKEKQKEAAKTAKKRCKDFKGYKFKGSGTMESAFAEYIMHTDLGLDGAEFVGSEEVVTNATSISIGENLNRGAAQTKFAQEVHTAVAGGSTRHIGQEDEINLTDEASKYVAELKGELVHHFSVYKENGVNQKGKTVYEVHSFYSYPSARNVQSRLDKTLDQELEMSRKIREQVSGN